VKIHLKSVLLFSFAMAWVTLAGCAMQSAAPEQDPAARITYTQAQANAGTMTFESRCRGCHDPSRFTADAFTGRWQDRTAAELFVFLRNAEPQPLHGGYANDHYLGLMAYIFELNDLPSGPTPLPSDLPALEVMSINWESN